MKLARLLASDRAKHPGSATLQADSTQARHVDGPPGQDKACCSECRGTEASTAASKEDQWSCGVCYEEVCCPFSLPCGHTVCGSCLEQLLGRQAKCPFCRVSVFRGCTFGRNVAMWNAIQARHPAEAAELSNSSAVITYHPRPPTRPPGPQGNTGLSQQVLSAIRSDAQQVMSDGEDTRSSQRMLADVERMQHPVQVMQHVLLQHREQLREDAALMARQTGGRHQAVGETSPTTSTVSASSDSPSRASAATQSTSTARVGLGLLAPLRSDSPLSEADQAETTFASPSSAGRAAPATGTRSLQTSPTRLMGSAAYVTNGDTSQPEVLRRAQAAFADLREIDTTWGSQAQPARPVPVDASLRSYPDAQRRLRAELDQIAALLQPEAEYLEAEYA